MDARGNAERIAEELLSSCRASVGGHGRAEVMKCAIIKARGFQEVLQEAADGRYGAEVQTEAKKLATEMDAILDSLPQAIMTHTYYII